MGASDGNVERKVYHQVMIRCAFLLITYILTHQDRSLIVMVYLPSSRQERQSESLSQLVTYHIDTHALISSPTSGLPICLKSPV